MLATLNDVHAGQWNRIEHLLATVIDALGVVSYHALVGPHADLKRGPRPKPPPPLPRPGAPRRQRRKATPSDLKRLFGGATYSD